MESIMIHIMFLEDLEMSQEVLKFVEEYAMDKYNLKVSLRIQAEQITNIPVNILERMITRTNTAKISIKIFNAIFDGNAIDRCSYGFWPPYAAGMIRYLQGNDPMAMSPEQFGALLKWSDDRSRARCFEFMQSAINRRNAVRDNSSNKTGQN